MAEGRGLLLQALADIPQLATLISAPAGSPVRRRLMLRSYLLTHRLRGGEMASVWRATDTRDGSRVIVKTSRRSSRRNALALYQTNCDALVPASYLMRIVDPVRREADMLQWARHESIVQSKEAFLWRGRPCLVIEHIHGPTLRDLVQGAKEGRWHYTNSFIIDVCRTLLEGLAKIHACNILHRDIKPSNILLDLMAARPRLIDFGLAAEICDLPRCEVFEGTYDYASPEGLACLFPLYNSEYDVLFGGDSDDRYGYKRPSPDFDGRSDLFSMGLVAYTLFTLKDKLLRGSYFFYPDPLAKLPDLLERKLPSHGPTLRERWIRRRLVKFIKICTKVKKVDRFRDATEALRFLDRSYRFLTR